MTSIPPILSQDGPLAYFLGVGIVILSFFGGLTMVAGHDAASNCIKAGGTWSHTLDQPQVYTYKNHEHDETKTDTAPHWSDKCTMPEGKK